MNTLEDAGALHFHDGLADFFAVGTGEHEFSLAGTGNGHLAVLVHIAIGMATEHQRFFPARYGRWNILEQDGSPEYGAVEFRPDNAVRARGKSLEVVFFYAVLIGGDGGALDSDTEPLDGFGGRIGYRVIRIVASLQSEIEVFCLEVHEGFKKLVLYYLPQNAGHLVAVKFRDRVLHWYLAHVGSLKIGFFEAL